jgi:hypothetical protein
MSKRLSNATRARILGAGLSLVCATALANEIKITLSGSQEVPPVVTSATGGGTVTINADMSVSANITTSGIAVTAAHIHMAPAGQNGPVVVPFSRSGDAWVAAPGARLTEAQYAAYKAGNLYINFHSAAYPGGEIRGQIRP